MPYLKVGSILQVKPKHFINLYAATDERLRFYEFARLGDEAIMLIIGFARWEVRRPTFDKFNTFFDETKASYKVLTRLGIGHIIAYTDAEKAYSYFTLLKHS